MGLFEAGKELLSTFSSLFQDPVKALGDAGGAVGDGDRRSGAGNIGQRLPGGSQVVQVLHGVSFSRHGLQRKHKVISDFGWGENDWRGPDPKPALNAESGARWHGGQRLGDGAGQLKAAASAERRPAACNYATSDREAAAALGESRAGNQEEKQKNSHARLQLFLGGGFHQGLQISNFKPAFSPRFQPGPVTCPRQAWVFLLTLFLLHRFAILFSSRNLLLSAKTC